VALVRGGRETGAGELPPVSTDTWQQLGVAAGMIAIAIVAARLVDRALARRLELDPEALTRYRVLRRSVTAVIVALGILSALLVIPPVRAVAGGVLASSAVAGIVIGMAARSTLANFVAGVMIAVTQPLRLGDEVEVGDASGTVDEIALTYTTLTNDLPRIPSEMRRSAAPSDWPRSEFPSRSPPISTASSNSPRRRRASRSRLRRGSQPLA
jgi:small-conductance mechanosensitive channel